MIGDVGVVGVTSLFVDHRRNMRPHSTNRIHPYLKSRGSIHETRRNQPVFTLGPLSLSVYDLWIASP